MGKLEDQLHLPQQQIDTGTIFCQGCCPCCLSRIGREFNFKCVFVLILSVSVFLSAIFWIFPLHSRQSGFDAKEEIRLRASVQAYFTLQKPVQLLIPEIARLEYDISGEIGVPFTKVSILSMHQAGVSDWTDVVFGFLSDPMDVPINPVSLSVLKVTLIELFLRQSNLTLTDSIFGQPSLVEILKFPGGITIIPEQAHSIWEIPQILFNFTLYNSVYEIKENFVELKEQLKSGLQLRPYENVFVQVTNKIGSTRDPPVTVEASIMSDRGSISPQRLKQLAQTITGSPAKNLGLNNSVFGKVKEISLSSYLNCTTQGTAPTPSPAPSPLQNDYAEEPSSSPYPAVAPSPGYHQSPPCSSCGVSHAPVPENGHAPSLPPISRSLAPSIVVTPPPRPGPSFGSNIPPSPSPGTRSNPRTPAAPPHASTAYPPPVGSTTQLSPDLSPLPVVSYGSSPNHDTRNGQVTPIASPSISPSPSSSATSLAFMEIWFFSLFPLVTLHLLGWSWW